MSTQRQGNIRTAPSNHVRRARYVNPDCQWQSGSRKDCSDIIDTVKLARTTFTDYHGEAKVCRAHVAAFIRQAQKDGTLA